MSITTESRKIMSEDLKVRTLRSIVSDIEALLDDTWHSANRLCETCAEFDQHRFETDSVITTLYMTASSLKFELYTISAKLLHYTDNGELGEASHTIEDLDMFKSEDYEPDSEGEE